MKKSKICNIIGILLMGMLVILHFMPFWSYDGMSTSIQSYTWFPTKHTELESYIVGQIGGEYNINNIVLMPIIVILSTIVGIVLNIKMSENFLVSMVPLGCGLVGAWGYITKPVFQLGTNWTLHLAVCIAMVAVAVLKVIFLAKKNK